MVRSAAARPVAPDRLDRVLDTARRGPSAGFSQAQSFVVVTDPAVRAALAERAGEPAYLLEGYPAWLGAAPVLVVVCTSQDPYDRRYAEADKGAVGGPADWPVPYRYVDAGCALMLLLLAAVDEGLVAGFLGVHRVPGVRELLAIPPEVEPIARQADRRAGCSTAARRWRGPRPTGAGARPGGPRRGPR
jgi:nitroreductase